MCYSERDTNPNILKHSHLEVSGEVNFPTCKSSSVVMIDLKYIFVELLAPQTRGTSCPDWFEIRCKERKPRVVSNSVGSVFTGGLLLPRLLPTRSSPTTHSDLSHPATSLSLLQILIQAQLLQGRLPWPPGLLG